MEGLRRLTVAAYVLAAVLMAAGCGGVIDSQPILTRAELVGTWAGPDGATMTFRDDHTVTVRHLDTTPLSNCRNVSADGTWQFLSPDGVSGPGLTGYSKGDLVGVAFSAQPILACSSEFTSWEINPPVGLCLDLDPDSPCTGPVLTKRPAARN